MGVGLWVIGTEKGGRGVIVGQSIGQAVSCAWQMHSREKQIKSGRNVGGTSGE